MPNERSTNGDAAIQLCYVDVGGTFTDAFLVDANGDFSTAKAPSTPADVRGGFVNAVEAAARAMGRELGDVLESPGVIVGYGATIALNALLTRRGGRPGLLITRGFEHFLYMGRGKQSWTELDRDARIHPQTHRMLEPLIPFKRVHGVSERTDCLANELIPLYEDDVERAVRALVEDGVDSIVVVYLWSFLNDAHERRTREIAEGLLSELGQEIPIYIRPRSRRSCASCRARMRR